MIFSGSGTALVTPFKDGAVDYEALEGLIAFQVDSGTDALIICGTTGEPSTMTAQEQRDTIQFAVDQVGGRIPVVGGSGGNNTAEVIEAANAIADVGANAVLAVTPYYNKTTQEGLVRHYEAVAENSELPLIVYNVPGRTGLNLEPATMAALAEDPRIVGLKEASADITQIVEMFRVLDGRVPVYSGNDDHVYPLLALGGAGVISVASNIVPAQMRELTQSYFDGDQQRSLNLQFELNPLISALFSEVSPIPVKAALAMMGMIEDELRLPLIPLSSGPRADLETQLRQLDLI